MRNLKKRQRRTEYVPLVSAKMNRSKGVVGEFSDRGGYTKDRKQWSLNHAREVFQDAEIYDEVYDCIMVMKAKANEDLICNPIYKFTEDDIWQYIHENEIDVNPLYQRGYRRVGCIGCPLGGRKQILREFNDYPKYKRNYIKAFDRMLKARREKGLKAMDRWTTAEEVFRWWIDDYRYIPKDQMTLDFGEQESR